MEGMTTNHDPSAEIQKREELDESWQRGFDWVEEKLGARIVSFERQARWRPAFFLGRPGRPSVSGAPRTWPPNWAVSGVVSTSCRAAVGWASPSACSLPVSRPSPR